MKVETDPISQLLSSATPTQPVEAPRGELGREDFLRMLIAQLENQDPLNPQDATEFTAQLAQFSSLEQLISIRESVDGLQGGNGGLGLAEIAALIGRDVVAESSQIEIGEPGAAPARFEVSMAQPASDVAVEILTGSGRVVRTLSLGRLQAGLQPVEWDGRNDAGEFVPPGVYELRVASSGDLDASAPATFVQGRVTAALPGTSDDPSVIMMGAIPVPVDRISEIRIGEDAP
jgi:flagellar basal-body rod modification protein FlgD